MKKVRLLCLLALLFAVGSAFTTTKLRIFYAQSTGGSNYKWVPDSPPPGLCEISLPVPCSVTMENGFTPFDNEVPTEHVEGTSEDESVYPE